MHPSITNPQSVYREMLAKVRRFNELGVLPTRIQAIGMLAPEYDVDRRMAALNSLIHNGFISSTQRTPMFRYSLYQLEVTQAGHDEIESWGEEE